MSSWKSKPRKNCIRKDAKFDTKTARVTAKLLALGLPYSDVGYILGISQFTIQSWQQRYPIFRKEIEKAREAIKSITLAQLLRAAWGYTYEEKEERFTSILNEDGTESQIKKKTTKITQKHQVPNPDLLKFILLNRAKEDWHDIKQIDVKSTNANFSIAGELESKAIDELVGSLVKKIESKEVEKKELNGKPESGDTNPVPIFDTNGDKSESGVQEKSTQ